MLPRTPVDHQGRFEAWLVAPYVQRGSIRGSARRGLLAVAVYVVPWSVIAALIGGLTGRASPRDLVLLQAANLLAVGLSFGFTWRLVIAGYISRLESWHSTGRPVEDAAAMVRLASRLPSRWSTASVVIYILVGIVTWIPAWIVTIEPMRLAVMVIIAGLLAACIVVWPMIYFIGELALRPVYADVAAVASARTRHELRMGSLRVRALLPVPLVTLSTGISAGALAVTLDDRSNQLALAIGVSLAFTVMYAAMLHFVVIAAALRPVDDLTEGVHRVATGEMSHRVPITSSDEFADLARDFNDMTRRLEAHEEEMRASRARIVTAADESRRQVERDLHDGAQQYLVLLGLKLGMVRRALSADPAKAAVLLDEADGDLGEALAELRDLAHGLYPAVLESDGLAAALKVAGDRCALPTVVDGDGAGRCAPEVEAAVYFCCLEAMQNAAKHAGEHATITVTLAQDDGALRFTVADDGRGYDASTVAPHGGLQNMADRIGALGGALTVETLPGHGTSVSGSVPVGAR